MPFDMLWSICTSIHKSLDLLKALHHICYPCAHLRGSNMPEQALGVNVLPQSYSRKLFCHSLWEVVLGCDSLFPTPTVVEMHRSIVPMRTILSRSLRTVTKLWDNGLYYRDPPRNDLHLVRLISPKWFDLGYNSHTKATNSHSKKQWHQKMEELSSSVQLRLDRSLLHPSVLLTAYNLNYVLWGIPLPRLFFAHGLTWRDIKWS